VRLSLASLVVGCLMLSLPSLAQEASPAVPEEPAHAAGGGLRLADAVSAALADGHAAQIAQLEADRSRDVAGQERSAYLPHASITSNAGYNSRQDEKLRAVDLAGEEKTYGLSSLGSDEGWVNVYLDQVVLDLATWQRIERAELEAEAATLAQEQEREVVAYEVLRRFTDVLRQERLAALASARVATLEAFDHQASLLLEAGRARPADRERAKLLLEEGRMDEEARANDVTSARISLALAMGRENGMPADPLDATSLPETRSGADLEPDVTGSPELRVLDLRRRVEEKGVSIARSGHLPTVAVRGGYSHYGVKRFDNYPDAYQVGLNVDVPIFQGLKTEYQVEGATKTAEIARIRYRSAFEAKRARVKQLAKRLAAAGDTPDLAARRAAVSREQLRLAELNLRADRGDLGAALAALDDSVRDGGAAIDAELDRVLLWADLHRESGNLARALTGSTAPPPASQN
jgi:outer membrane protein